MFHILPEQKLSIGDESEFSTGGKTSGSQTDE
jgi:hypothetical protein